MKLNKLWSFLTSKSHEGTGFKAGTRPAIILEALCEGHLLSGWSACKLINSGEGGRGLRRVVKRLKMRGINPVVNTVTNKRNGIVKIFSLAPWQREAARNLIGGRR